MLTHCFSVIAQSSSGGGIASLLVSLIQLGLLIAAAAGAWKTFEKAGQPGWAAIIPIYNAWVLCKIVGKPVLWFILCLIPFVNIVIGILLLIELAKSFGKGPGFGVGLALLGFVFFPMLGFGDAQYQGPASAPGFPVAPPQPQG